MNAPEFPIDWDQLERYATGEGTAEERKALHAWVESSVELQTLADAMGDIGRPPGAPVAAWEARGGWQRLQRRMRWAEQARRKAGGTRGWRRAFSWPVAAAAAVLVMAGVVIAMEMRARSTRKPTAVAAVPMREMVTERRERAVFHLPDGSRVTLAAETRMRVPLAYRASTGSRDVYLEGEAYFEVDHDPARPFRVHTRHGIAEDLGTEFVVAAYPETHDMQVIVASGTVALQSLDSVSAGPRAFFTLVPGDLARIDSMGTATLRRNVELSHYLSWIEGDLVFSGTRLRDALPTLARWYDLDIRLADSALGDRRLSARIRHQSPEQVLALLALSLDLQVERRQGFVILASRRRLAPSR